MQTTKLSSQDILPLTCTRTGTCCHGKKVLLNPWELICFAREKKITTREFRDLYTEFGGIRLLFDGVEDHKKQKACSQYVDGFGCSVHLGRPLACRLYPLGRQIQSNEVHYMYQGETFPCKLECPDVVKLPELSVGEYLKGQNSESFEIAQDTYLDLMQNIADIAFELLLESGLAASGDTATLKLWREMGKESPENLALRLGETWIDSLMLPEISEEIDNPSDFAQKHYELLQLKAQEEFGALATPEDVHQAAVLIMGVALHLATGIGADKESLVSLWIDTAKEHGAKE